MGSGEKEERNVWPRVMWNDVVKRADTGRAACAGAGVDAGGVPFFVLQMTITLCAQWCNEGEDDRFRSHFVQTQNLNNNATAHDVGTCYKEVPHQGLGIEVPLPISASFTCNQQLFAARQSSLIDYFVF